MQSQAKTVEQYLAELPEDRRAALQAVRKVILANLDRGYAEVMSYGMIGYCVPHSVYPAGYHCDPKQPLPFAGLASQKGHMSLYMMGLYFDQQEGSKATGVLDWFQKAWAKSGKKLDMGKSCIRFKKLEDLPLDVIGEAVRRVPTSAYIATYERALDARKRAAPSKPADKSASARKPAARKSAAAKAKKK